MNSSTGHESNRLRPAAEPRSELEENLEVLRQVPAFSGVPLDRLKLYAYLSKRIICEPGEFLFEQGDDDHRGYIVLSGKGRVIRQYLDRSVFLQELKEGDFFGGLALLAEIKRLFSVRAVTRMECLTLDRESFRKLVMQFPDVAIKVLNVMIKRIVSLEERLLDKQIDEGIFE